jgi:pyruvate,orthophosphate dikinase
MSDALFIGGRQSDAGVTPELVGNKAANLARLDRLGLRVPPALALPTALCRDFHTRGAMPADLPAHLAGSLRQLEDATGLMLGDRRPLLLSVRSSPPISMPGMLDTVLNVGLTERSVQALIRHTGNPWLAWDSYRRLALSFASVVYQLDRRPFDELTATHLARANAETVHELDPLALRDLARATAARVERATGLPLARDPEAQLTTAIEAVLRSWTAPRAREYRRINGIPDDVGTGVLVQTMMFGNSGAASGSGVGFTRNPATGDNELYVDFLFNAQGEDVVSGKSRVTDASLLAALLPAVYAELLAVAPVLERAFGDMQDFEFTVDDGQLFYLQTRAGKRTPWAAVRIAADLVCGGVIEPDQALRRLANYDLHTIVRRSLRPRSSDVPLARATSAGLGVATGRLAFDAARACELATRGPVVLARADLSTDDIAGLHAAAGLITTFGGRTSHAAVVARQLGKPCLVGCSDLRIEPDGRACSIGDRRLLEGDVVTLDAGAGDVYAGEVPVIVERPDEALAVIEGLRTQPA